MDKKKNKGAAAPRNVRKIAVRLLDSCELEGKYVNLAISSHITDGLTPPERSLLTALVYTTVEHKLTYDYYISSIASRSTDKIDIHTLNILRLGICQLVDMRGVPDFAAVNETVKLGSNKGERAFINGVLRRAASMKRDNSLPMPKRERNEIRYLSVKYSFPQWIVRKFADTYGIEECERLLCSFNSTDYTDITVNTEKISVCELRDKLASLGHEVSESARSPISLRIRGSVNPSLLPGFAEGEFFVQDESCAISASVLGTEHGDTVVDVCACPGGKSFAAAILAGREGRVYSFDLHESKLSLIESGRERLSLSNITVACRDALTPDESLFDSCDRVICDVPCSGLGVLGKKPDLRYRSDEGLSELCALQREILSESSRYVKAGGVLVYSTCTLNKDENERAVAEFLDTHPAFSLSPFTLGELSSDTGELTLLPHIHNTDGFFIARLVRNK